jgi:hypothetical protein
MSSSMKTEPFIMLLGEKGSQGRDKEASQTRDYRVAKNGTHRAARPNPSQHKECVARETAGWVGARNQTAMPGFVALYQSRNCLNAVPRWLY